MKKLALVLTLTAITATPVMADTYVGVNAGTNKMDITGLGSSTGFGVLGGYTFSDMLAAEVSYNNLGDATFTGGGTISGSVMGIAAVGSFPVSKDIALMAKLGFASSTISGGGVSESKSDLAYGVGAQYNLSKTTGIRVNYDSFNVGSTSSKSSTLMSVGVVFKM